MRSNLATRTFIGAAAVLFSAVLVAPGAHAAAPGDSGAQGSSAEHRNDAEAPSQGDERRTSEPAEAGGATGNAAAPLDEPQPASNADFSGNGANDHGAYDSTRDGSASENGNGDGAATGEPCAGCVGAADNKNPLGQFPDSSDANNGYECDGNSGIAKTNPAHTGCVLASSSDVPTVTSSAQVLGVVFTAPVPDSPASSVLSSSTAPLAATGSPAGLVPLAAFGFALLAVGALLRRGAARTV